MQPRGSSRERDCDSDPSASSPTPLRGDFIPVSPATTTRSRSLSPRKRLVRQPLHIRMNLTEGQMDKITEAFSQKVNSSPRGSRAEATLTTPKSTPRKKKTSTSRSGPHHSGVSTMEYSPGYESTTFSELMPRQEPRHSDHAASATLATRRQRAPPPPLNLFNGPHRGNDHCGIEIEPETALVSPLSQGVTEGSRYSNDDPTPVSPHNVGRTPQLEPSSSRRRGAACDSEELNQQIVDAYHKWVRDHSPSATGGSPSRSMAHGYELRRPKSTVEGHLRSTRGDTPSPAEDKVSMLPPDPTPPFSPLPLYFRGQGFPTTKKGGKTMIGEAGWLQRTGDVAEATRKTPPKKPGILSSLKKVAKDMADLHSSRRLQNEGRIASASQVAISLDAREQSLLYVELEFHLSSALNSYITVQLDKGRLVPDKLKKVADAWQHKGRPKVVGFRYDLETQIELIGLHVDEFRFYGRRQGNPVEINGLLHAMKVDARAMGVRTFCQPDSVIAKQLVDAQSLFKMLAVSEPHQVALAEVAQFFKVIVERELHHHHQERSG